MWNERNKAYMAALGLALIVGFSFMITKLTIGLASPIETLAHRFTISFLTLLILIFTGTIKLQFTWDEIRILLPLSMFYPILFFSFQIYGLQYIASSEAGIIQATAPIITMILAALLLQEKSSRKQKFFMMLSLFGVFYISFMKGLSLSNASLYGLILMLFSATASATSNVLSRKFSRRYGFIKITALAITVGFLVFNLLSFGLHISMGNLTSYFDPLKNRTYLLAVIFLGTLSTLGTSLLSNYSLSKLEASRMSIITHLGTVISIMAGVIILHEPLYFYHILGAILILLGVIGTNYVGRHHPIIH
ncbi:MAG: DMT family transporter [Clostridiaceae bacterium]